jgi:hypothetical protein
VEAGHCGALQAPGKGTGLCLSKDSRRLISTTEDEGSGREELVGQRTRRAVDLDPKTMTGGNKLSHGGTPEKVLQRSVG